MEPGSVFEWSLESELSTGAERTEYVSTGTQILAQNTPNTEADWYTVNSYYEKRRHYNPAKYQFAAEI